MKILLLAIISLFLLTGCLEDRIILVPQSEYYPTFPIDDFKKSEKYEFYPWTETESNGTVYIVSHEKDFNGFVYNTNNLRRKYNLLVRKVTKFNSDIDELNNIQNNKKPQEVDKLFIKTN